MTTRTSQNTRHLPDIQRGESFTLFVNDQEIQAFPGETVAGALIAAGIKVFNHSDDGSPRSLYCGIGQCFSCLVTVDGQPNVRACVTMAVPGMRVHTEQGVKP